MRQDARKTQERIQLLKIIFTHEGNVKPMLCNTSNSDRRSNIGLWPVQPDDMLAAARSAGFNLLGAQAKCLCSAFGRTGKMPMFRCVRSIFVRNTQSTRARARFQLREIRASPRG